MHRTRRRNSLRGLKAPPALARNVPFKAAKVDSITILVVDNEPALAEAVAEILRLDGHAVSTATSGLAALEQLNAHPVDLVISDLLMPGMSGERLHAELRARGAEPLGFVIMSSAPASLVQAFVGSGSPFLQKPIDPAALLALAADCASAMPGKRSARS